MFAALALIITASPLASDDAAERLTAVQAWAQKQKKPLLALKDARLLTDCIELAPIADTGCAQPAPLCPLREGDDGSAGTRRESLSLWLKSPDHIAKHVQVWRSSVYEPKILECDPPEPLFGAPSPEQRLKDLAAFRKTHAKEYAKCVIRAEKDARDDAEEISCDVVLVNACRKEAYVKCKARNLGKKATPPPTTVQRVEL